MLPDISIKIYNNWWNRSPIDWKIKQIDDAKHVQKSIHKDVMARKKERREEAKRKRLEARKALGFDYLDEEEEERIAELEALGMDNSNISAQKLIDNSHDKSNSADLLRPVKTQKTAAGPKDGYGEEEYYDNEAYGGEYGDEYGDEMGAKSAKYKKAATKKKKKGKKTAADTIDSESVKKSITKKTTQSPKKKK